MAAIWNLASFSLVDIGDASEELTTRDDGGSKLLLIVIIVY